MLLRKLRRFTLIAFASAMLFAQVPQSVQTPHDVEPAETRLPNGKLQRDEILKADHEKSLEDAAKLIDLTEELKIELEKNDRHVLSVATLKKLDEIERLTKRIRGRLKRF